MNIEKTFFCIFAFWYFYKYGVPPFIDYFLMKFYVIYENLMLLDLFDSFSDTSSTDSPIPELSDQIVEKPVPKYEDKYLSNIRQLSKEWQFTNDEIEEKNQLYGKIYKEAVNNIKSEIDDLSKEIDTYVKEKENDTDNVQYVENINDDGDELVEETTLEERNEFRTEQIKELTERVNSLKIKIETDEGCNELKIDSEKQANDFIINRKIEKLQNCHVMEKTPQGNVLMLYDNNRNSFKYYSDSTVPYRYLEVVARKYVKFFNCRPLFVDMEEELKLFEEKWTKEYELKKAKEAEEKLRAEEAINNNKSIEKKKNVFAKFKNYNKHIGGKISMAAPPKNSIPNKANFETKENEKIILKERANRYTYEGKFANFSFLQKVEKKVFNKKLGITFADFKKMQK